MKPKRIQSHKCDNCDSVFIDDNRADGIPNGVSVEYDDGRVITLCANCIIKLGKLSEEEKKNFFERIGIQSAE